MAATTIPQSPFPTASLRRRRRTKRLRRCHSLLTTYSALCLWLSSPLVTLQTIQARGQRRWFGQRRQQQQQGGGVQQEGTAVESSTSMCLPETGETSAAAAATTCQVTCDPSSLEHVLVAAAATQSSSSSASYSAPSHGSSTSTEKTLDYIRDWWLGSHDNNAQQHHTSSTSRSGNSAQVLWTNLRAIVNHEPPVGMVALIVTLRLVWTGRIWTVYRRHTQYDQRSSPLQEQQQQSESSGGKRRGRRKRSDGIALDADDVSYSLAGGVEKIRRQLCWSALNGVLLLQRTQQEQETASSDSSSDSSSSTQVVEAAVNALSVSYKPRESRFKFVQEMIEPLSTLESVLMSMDDDKAITTPSSHRTTKKSRQKNRNKSTTKVQLRDRWEPPQTDMAIVLQMAAKTAEIRALDALLRVSRDQLVTTSSRLYRNLKHWKRRVTLNNNLSWLLNWLMRDSTMEGDRMRLAFAKAAFQSEVTKLGSIAQVLMERPEDMSDQSLLDALSKSHHDGGNQTDSKQPTRDTPNAKNQTQRPAGAKKQWGPRSLFKALPKVSKYSLRFNAEGKGRLSLRVYDGETTIQSEVAWDELLHNSQVNPREWIEQAHDWTERARSVLCTVLKESVETSVSDNVEAKQGLDVIDQWCTYDCETCLDLDKQWLAILNLVDNLDSLKRVGEGREIGIVDSGVRLWAERLDVFGIPSALAAVGMAKLLHNHLLPYWPTFKQAAINALSISWGIFKQRFWSPFYNIVQGLMNKDTGLLEAFDIENEEQSLDNMLEDLGLGDGSAATRKEALQGASRLYEDQLENGVLRSALRGKLVRLLLIQVQQLKAGLLHAMSSIDVLVAANRLNIQILAAIPAVLIVYFGTQVIFRSLFTLRAKDIRPIKDVHAEMADYLDELEMTFILATPLEVSMSVESANGTDSTVKETRLTETLQPADLGESVLRIHAYLVLLNYCGPLFPYRATSSIHRSMQELVTSYRLGTERQVALLRLIKQKHMDLLKYL